MSKASGSIDLKSLKVAGEGASKYITSIDSNNGIQVHAENNTDINYVQINADGMEIFNTDGASINPSAVSVAQFGTTARIGKINNVRVEIDEDSFIMLDSSGTEFAHIGSPNSVPVTDTFICEQSSTTGYLLSYVPSGTIVVKINDTETTNFVQQSNPQAITINDPLTVGDEITVDYTTTSEIKYYTFGIRDGNAGGYSVAEGQNTTASGTYSHAEGNYTEAKGYASHAEGSAWASGNFSHAEGYASKANGSYSHAEGNGSSATNAASHAEGSGTKASGRFAHAEGKDTRAASDCTHAEGMNTNAGSLCAHAEGEGSYAFGNNSHAQNYYTVAQRKSQTAIGEYNIMEGGSSSTLGTYALIIGNGSSALNRSNALAVTWDGNVYIDLAGYATPYTTDKKIYDALVELSWDSEVTV